MKWGNKYCLLIILLLVFLLVAVLYWPNRSQISEIPQLRTFSDASSARIAMQSAYLEERSYKLNGVRILPSLKYVALAKRFYELNHGLISSQQIYPDWLFKYGLLPEAVMPTDEGCLSAIPTMAKVDISGILTPDRVSGAKKFLLNYEGDKFETKMITIYSTKMLTADKSLDSKTGCAQDFDSLICYRDNLINYLMFETGLVFYEVGKKQYELALMLKSYLNDDDEFYYDILTQNGLQTIPYEQLFKKVVGISFPQKLFALFDNAKKAASEWMPPDVMAFPSDKKTLLLFTSRTCLYCKQFLAEVAINKELQKALSSYRLIKIDKETNLNLIKKYNINGYPRFVMLDAHLAELRRKAGYDNDDKDDIIKFLAQGDLQ